MDTKSKQKRRGISQKATKKQNGGDFVFRLAYLDRQLCQKLWQKKIELSQQQIKQAADIYHTWQKAGTDGKNFQKAEVYRSVGFKEVEEKNFVLTPSKYIKFIDKDLQIDFQKEMKRIQKATKDLLEEERQAQKMLEKAFCEAGYAID